MGSSHVRWIDSDPLPIQDPINNSISLSRVERTLNKDLKTIFNNIHSIGHFFNFDSEKSSVLFILT